MHYQLQHVCITISSLLSCAHSVVILEAVSDFQPLSVQVISESTDISLVTVDDEMGMECEESIRLEFVHQFPPYVIFLASQGEFIRDTAIVKVIDNDRECDYFL